MGWVGGRAFLRDPRLPALCPSPPRRLLPCPVARRFPKRKGKLRGRPGRGHLQEPSVCTCGARSRSGVESCECPAGPASRRSPLVRTRAPVSGSGAVRVKPACVHGRSVAWARLCC